MHIKFAGKIVRLKVHMTITSPMTLPFIRGHKWCLAAEPRPRLFPVPGRLLPRVTVAAADWLADVDWLMLIGWCWLADCRNSRSCPKVRGNVSQFTIGADFLFEPITVFKDKVTAGFNMHNSSFRIIISVYNAISKRKSLSIFCSVLTNTSSTTTRSYAHAVIRAIVRSIMHFDYRVMSGRKCNQNGSRSL